MNLGNQGDGTLVAWCLMPEVLERHPHLAKPDGHVGDGISLTGDEFDFTDFSENEMSLEGVMFYSTDPARDGYVLTSAGQTVRKTASVGTEASVTASPTATTATVSALPSSGGQSLAGLITLVAVLVLMGSGVAALGLLRRGSS